ncbi:hypothetical protein [Brevundimonas sp. LjRoot202]|uniref:hypothetical protein n=1 Tax=Brevundimonas sp. LjRoot202 TaxID=3342281 RepID=UPI003F501706
MMKKALIPVLAIAAASVAVPAAAQNYDRYDRYDRNDRYEQNRGGWQSISNRKHQLDRRINVGLRNGSLSRREGRRLENELNRLVRLEHSYMRGGLTRWERNDLDRRYDRLAVQVRIERRDRDDRRW